VGIYIKHPLDLGAQVFRMNRADLTLGGVRLTDYWEVANCREFDCEQYERGWTSTYDPSTELGRRQIRFVRKLKNRSFREDSGGDGLVRFHFPPGQKCFRGPHQKPIERDPIFNHLARGRDSVVMDYDQFHDTMNETVVQIRQARREV